MAAIVISQTWADGTVLLVQVSNGNSPAYPDELNQLRHEAITTFKELTEEAGDG